MQKNASGRWISVTKSLPACFLCSAYLLKLKKLKRTTLFFRKKVPTFLHEGRHFLCKRSLYSYPYIPMYIRIHANETRNICLWSREYMQMQPDFPCKGISKGRLTVLMCQPNCLICNKMSGKIDTGCYFDLSEYLCWRKYRKAFSSLYKKSIEEISCWKEKNYSLNRTMVLIFGFYDMV